MRAIVYDGYGGPDVLRVADLPDPVPGPGQVRVAVYVAGVNPVDAKVRRGDLAAFLPAHFPQRIGNEYAGTISALGTGVDTFAVGDEVLGSASAQAYAELVVVDVVDVVRKPIGLSWDVAGALPAVAQTAATALDALAIGAGDTVLIHAAAGGVGTIAVQLARSRGATVIGTASKENHDYLRRLGALPVEYGPGLVQRVVDITPGGVSAALDLVGGEAISVSLELVADRRRVGTTVDAAAAVKLGIQRVGGRSLPALQEIAAAVANGGWVLPVDASFDLQTARRAHESIESGHVRGKLALRVRQWRSNAGMPTTDVYRLTSRFDKVL
jgi:enoyl reductase